MKYLILLTTLFAFSACSKNDAKVSTFLDCEEITENFKEYNGEIIDCQFHFQLTEYNDQQYIELFAHCADLTRPFVINENCQDICAINPRDENSECGQYLRNREIIEIVLLEK